MPDIVKVYNLDQGGVQLVKSDQHMADNEFRQLQNAEFGDDQSSGGLETRAGFSKFNSVAMDGEVLGFINAPLIDLRESAGVGIARRSFTSDELNTLNATPLIIVPAPGPGLLLMPIQVTIRGTRGATAWTAGPAIEIVYEGLTTPSLLTAGIFMTFLNNNNGTPQDRFISVLRVNTATHAANGDLSNLGLRVRLFADSNPGDPATMEMQLLYQVVHGIYDEEE